MEGNAVVVEAMSKSNLQSKSFETEKLINLNKYDENYEWLDSDKLIKLDLKDEIIAQNDYDLFFRELSMYVQGLYIYIYYIKYYA